MTQSQRTRIVSLAIGTAAASGLGMIPVHRLPRPVRVGYVALPAVLTTGVSLLAAQGRPGAPDDGDASRLRGLRTPTLPEAALSLGLGGLMAGAGVAGLRLDGAVEGFLRRRGVKAPRVWIGLAPGMPEDEYEPEAQAIAELLDTGVAPTAAQLDELWEHWFSEPLSPLLGARRMDSLLEELAALVPEHPVV